MQKFLSDLPFFVEVAKWKSFTQAANALDVPLPTISRRIAALEKSLGIQLFNRSKRKVELTEAGCGFYESCEFVVAEAYNALENLLREQRKHTGRIRLALPATVYFTSMQGALGAFAMKYPGIEMHVHFSTRWLDLYSEPFDLEIRTGDLPDSDLIVRKLITSEMGVYAAPELLNRYHVPHEPDELTDFPYIHMTIFSRHGLELRKDGKAEFVSMHPAHTVNGLALALDFLLAGQGIAAIEVGTARKYEQAGEIVRLLPEWSTPGVTISLVRASGKTSHRVQLFVDYLVEYFKKHRQFRP